jgi:hypothetical protein
VRFAKASDKKRPAIRPVFMCDCISVEEGYLQQY